jgi:hypothetical protein
MSAVWLSDFGVARATIAIPINANPSRTGIHGKGLVLVRWNFLADLPIAMAPAKMELVLQSLTDLGK